MRREPARLLLVLCTVALLAVSGCTSGPASPDRGDAPRPSLSADTPASPPTPTVEVRDDLAAVFARAGVKGTFAFFDVDNGRLVLVDRTRAERPMVPASTYKIPHSLIALEIGVVTDAEQKIPYGGSPQPVKAWERDMGLRDAVKVSNVPVFQEIARRVGAEREHDWMVRLGYGNAEVGAAVDRFWLDGPLEISARDQAVWLSRLARGELPASPAHQALVRDLLRLEKRGEYALYGKTGWAASVNPQVGWWVGWVENAGRLYCFALNLDIAHDTDAERRIAVGRELLRNLDALPPEGDQP
ncbi:MAG TPA: class D beta-lactamase [Micromonospora sp.]